MQVLWHGARVGGSDRERPHAVVEHPQLLSALVQWLSAAKDLGLVAIITHEAAPGQPETHEAHHLFVTASGKGLVDGLAAAMDALT